MTNKFEKNIDNNIVWQDFTVNREQITKVRNYRSLIVWFTGLSGSGKSTLANAVNISLFKKGYCSYVLDGDNVRHGLCKDLGFSDVDREENIRRISEVSKLFIDAGIITLTAFVSPFIADRVKAKSIVKAEDFIEVYCSANLKTCEDRDVKGLYAKARLGEIKEFTGISSPYEPPVNPDIVIDSSLKTINESVDEIVKYIENKIVL